MAKKIFLLTALFFLGAFIYAQQAARTPAVQWRGYMLEVDKFTGNAVHAGDRVDILMTFKAFIKQQNKEEVITATILQRISVLDVISEGGKYGLVLTLDPRDAQYLFLAEKTADLKIILRNPQDSALNPLDIASFSKLFGH